MTFEYDIFISYGHLDDEDPAGEVKGWVDLLVERLPRVVAGYLGTKPRVWRDEEALSRHRPLDEAIVEGIRRSRLFVPVLTPRYACSEWCLRELETFCAAAPAQRSRVFKVVKTPLLLAGAKEHEALRDLLGYPFYEMDGNRPREFSPDVAPAKDQRYWDALGRLAWDISNALAEMRKAEGEEGADGEGLARRPAPPESVKGFVYLAESTSDLAKEREQVRDELRQRGYGVLPEQRLPLEEKRKAEEAVRSDLARCGLSVHMVGARYGSTPEDDPASVVRIQESLAAARGEADPSFRRVLWMPPGLSAQAPEVTDARQRDFISGIQTRLTEGAELLQTTVEDLKTRVVEQLAAAERAEAERRRKEAEGEERRRRAQQEGERDGADATAARHQQKLKQVYLICENSDRSLVRPIRQYLHKEKFEVITRLEGEGGEAAERLTEYHRKNLRECDAALIYFGNGDEPWVRKNLEDLVKAYGYGRENDWSASAVYVGPQPSEQKEDFLTNMVPYVIYNFSEFNPETLSEFVEAVRAAEGGSL